MYSFMEILHTASKNHYIKMFKIKSILELPYILNVYYQGLFYNAVFHRYVSLIQVTSLRRILHMSKIVAE